MGSLSSPWVMDVASRPSATKRVAFPFGRLNAQMLSRVFSSVCNRSPRSSAASSWRSLMNARLSNELWSWITEHEQRDLAIKR